MEKNYYKEFIDFLKRHNLFNKEAIDYLQKNAFFFNYLEEEYRDFIGCFFSINKKNKKLEKITLFVPYIKNEKTLIINIHEYTHALLNYKYLGKKFNVHDDIEILPMLYERLYQIESKSEKAQSYINYLNSYITKNSDIKYKIAIDTQDQMLDFYQKEKNPEKLQIKAKKLSKKYKKHQK